ncbi:MAG: hypothetical protein HYS12_25365 [Planctomycetes bacterium]|nr:hypothetical protein [Planctomycetota bacterium]
MAHQLREPAPVRSLRPDVPEEIAALIARMMAKAPEQRPQTHGEVTAALAKWLSLPLPPPTDDEIPPLCPAVLGPGSGLPPGVPASGMVCPAADTEQSLSRADTEQPATKPPAPTPPLAAPVAAPVTMAVVPLSLLRLWPRVRAWWAAIAAVALALLGRVAWWRLQSRRSSERARPRIGPAARPGAARKEGEARDRTPSAGSAGTRGGPSLLRWVVKKCGRIGGGAP